MGYMESWARIAIEPLLGIDYSSEQTVDTARQFLFYDEDASPKNPSFYR